MFNCIKKVKNAIKIYLIIDVIKYLKTNLKHS